MWLLFNCAFMQDRTRLPAVSAEKRQPNQFDIVIAPLQTGQVNYPRPVLILDVIGDNAIVSPISTKWDLFNEMRGDFPLTGEMLVGTGLRGEGFVIGERATIPISSLYNTFVGRLSGIALKRFMRCCV